MSLPIPNLDDKTFEELVAEARELIPRYAPEWSDHNLSDPGITLIELFAWITEMQMYSLNRVTDGNYRKFLKLVGVRCLPATPAIATVTFELPQLDNGSTIVPAGTKIAAANALTGRDITFETDEEIPITPLVLKKIVTNEQSQWYDKTKFNTAKGGYYFAFGERATENNMLYIALAAADFPTENIHILVHLYDSDFPVAGNDTNNIEIIPTAKIGWEYWNGNDWQEIEILADNTYQLSKSGRIIMKSPADIQKLYLEDAAPYLSQLERELFYWIRARVIRSGYEIPPRIDTLSINAVSVTQKNSIKNYVSEKYSGSRQPSQKIALLNVPDPLESVKVRIFENDNAWHQWSYVRNFDNSGPRDRHFMISLSEQQIVFGDGQQGAVPPKSAQLSENIELHQFRLGTDYDSFTSTGLPFQQFELRHSPVLPGSIILEVREEDHHWHRWSVVVDFDNSTPADRHFMIDMQQGVITFGDGMHGRIPPTSENGTNNICVLEYVNGDGIVGNVPAKSIKKILSQSLQHLKVENNRPATGGSDAETLDAAKIRARKSLKQRHRAITSEDYEKLALATPGIKVARVKVLPLYHPRYPSMKMPDCVTIVAVPHTLPNTNVSYPVPGDGFLKTIFNHLNPKRLITTKLHVIAPDYIKVEVTASVKIDPRMSAATAKFNIEQALKKFIHPVTGGPENSGWQFGRAVMKSEIYQVIENVPGTRCVEYLSLAAEGCYSVANRNIKISKIGLVYSGEHAIEVYS